MIRMIFLAALLLLPVRALAYGDRFIEANELSITFIDMFHNGRDPLITGGDLPHREVGKRLNLGVNLDIAKVFFWDNLIHTATDRNQLTGGGQFRTVGWQHKLGIRLFEGVEVFFHHHSQHVLDHTYKNDLFPVEDGVGIRLYIIGGPKRESLF